MGYFNHVSEDGCRGRMAALQYCCVEGGLMCVCRWCLSGLMCVRIESLGSVGGCPSW